MILIIIVFILQGNKLIKDSKLTNVVDVENKKPDKPENVVTDDKNKKVCENQDATARQMGNFEKGVQKFMDRQRGGAKRPRESESDEEVSEVSDVETDELSTDDDDEDDLQQMVMEKREKKREEERTERTQRHNAKKLIKKTYGEVAKTPFMVKVKAESLNETRYELGQTDFDNISMGLSLLMMEQISKGVDWKMGERGILHEEGAIYVEALNKVTYEALTKGIPGIEVPDEMKGAYKYVTDRKENRTRVMKIWINKKFWLKREAIEMMMWNSNYELRNFRMKDDDGTEKKPIFRVIGGGIDKEKEIIKRRDGTEGDNFIVTIEMEECLMKPIVWEAEYGLEGFINYLPMTRVMLQGGGIEKLIREKRRQENKKKGVKKPKRQMTEEEKEAKKKRRKENKMAKKIEERREKANKK